MTKKSSSLDSFLEDEKDPLEVVESKEEEIKKPAVPPVTTAPPVPPPAKVEFKKRKFEREMPDTSGLSLSPKLLPPITRRRMAIYQLLSADVKFDHRVVEGPNRIEPAPFEMHPIYELFDPFEPVLAKRRKRMIYSNDIATHEYYNTNATTIDVNTNTRIEMPQFVHGQIAIDALKEYIKFCWLELHPQNVNNKFRDKTKAAKFKRIDIEFHSPHVQLMQRDLSRDAETHVIGLKADQLINLAAAFGIPSTTAITDMRLQMRKEAYDHPREVLFKSPDNKATTMMNIMKALDLGIIDFDPDTQQFYLGDDKNPVHLVLIDKTPLEDFARFLISDEGQDVKQEVENLLSFWQ